MKYKVPFIKPSFPNLKDLEKDYAQIVENNWYTNFGPFETEFSKLCGIYTDTHATSIANCTLGLEAVISILFDTAKKKVIVPSFTFAAGAEAIIRSGFTPVFIDITKESLQPDIKQAESILANNEDMAGILLCNIFGVGNPDVGLWEELAREYKIPLIIDSAAGFGSRYADGKRIGGRGDCEVFSMHATKPFAIGEGGMVTSKNSDFIKKVRSWQNFGFGADRNVAQIGTNAKLQEINAAIGLQQLDGFENRLSSRRDTLDKYKERLAKIDVKFQINDHNSTVAFASIVLADKAVANATYNRLLDSGVEVKKYYAPLHQQEGIRRYAEQPFDLAVTEDIAAKILSLPVHDFMSSEDIDLISNTILESMSK